MNLVSLVYYLVGNVFVYPCEDSLIYHACIVGIVDERMLSTQT